jgi:hypothetical protein
MVSRHAILSAVSSAGNNAATLLTPLYEPSWQRRLIFFSLAETNPLSVYYCERTIILGFDARDWRSVGRNTGSRAIV